MKLKLIILFMLSVFLLGCAQNQMYVWGNYSKTLYKLKKTPNEETFNDHKETLIEIITKSNEQGKRVPPGVYCEYAMMLAKDGKKDESLKYLDLEEKTYPESAVFVTNIRKNLNSEAKK